MTAAPAMPGLTRRAACLLVLAGRASGLRTRTGTLEIPAQGDHGPGLRRDAFDGRAFRHELQNAWDMQYTATFSVGGERLTGVLDTGSFELMVFDRDCETCGMAASYHEPSSTDVHLGTRRRQHTYGSGSCVAQAAWDKVQIGSAVVENQDLWLAKECSMPLLEAASFNAIVGIGPPGQPAKFAQWRMRDLQKLEVNYTSQGKAVPDEVLRAKHEVQQDLLESQDEKALLDRLRIVTFSACFGRARGSSAWITWNDITREGMPGVKKVPVLGEMTWGIKLGAVGLRSPSDEFTIGCQDGCGAIMDTGTSLLGLPKSLYTALHDSLVRDFGPQLDCTDLDRFPKLTILLGEHRLHLPPSVYIGRTSGDLDAETGAFFRREQFTSKRCHLLIMDVGEHKTQFGPMLVLGIPFLRYYHTTFHLGDNSTGRSLFISPADESCEPDLSPALREFSRAGESLMQVDLSKVRVPGWLGSPPSAI